MTGIASALFLLFCVVSAIGLGWLPDLSWVNWRAINVLAVVFGGAGFFVIMGEAVRLIPGNTIDSRKSKAVNELRTLQSTVQSLRIALCVKAVRTQHSPPTFEEDVRQGKLACEWIGNIAGLIAHLDADTVPEIDRAKISTFPTEINDDYLVKLKDKLFRDIVDYIRLRDEYLANKARLEPSSLEEAAIFFGPYLAACAIGFALFGVLYGPS